MCEVTTSNKYLLLMVPVSLEAKLRKDAYLRFSCARSIYLHICYQRKGKHLKNTNLPVVEF